MKKIINMMIILSFLCSSYLFSQETSKVGTTAAQFLKIGVGARAVAMGEAFMATANDASAIYWNAAGLAKLNQNEVLFMHSEWLADMTYNFASIIAPLGEVGTFGAFVTSLNTPDEEIRTVYQPEGTGELFNATNIAIGISYARMLTDKFSVGFTGKYVRERIWTMSSSAMALDIGTVYQSNFKNLRIGLSISNFGTKMKMDGRAGLLFVDIDKTIEGNNDQIKAQLVMDEWDLPLYFRAGFAVEPIQNEMMRLTVAADATHPNDNKEYINTGFEYAIRETVFLRGGYRAIGLSEAEGGLTLGGGLAYSFGTTAAMSLDYAFVDYNRLGNVHRYSLSVLF